MQSQLDDKDRTIRIQQNLISKLEAEVNQANVGKTPAQIEQAIQTVSMATQTDRVCIDNNEYFSFFHLLQLKFFNFFKQVRPLSMNFDGTNR